MAFQRSRHVLRLGLKSIAVHRLRSSLTVIGIFLGVAVVIIMLAIGEGARYEATQQIKDLGATNIIVRSVKPVEDTKQQQAQFVLDYGLTTPDLERIRQTIPTVRSATPVRESRKEVRYLDRKLEARVVAVMPNFLGMTGLALDRGRFIDDLDNERFSNVVVLAAETAETLFPFDDPIGRKVRVGEAHYYTVIGVTQRRAPSAGVGASLAPQDYNRDVYIPFVTDKVRFGRILTYFRAGTFQAEKLEISQITVAVDHLEHVRRTAEVIGGLLEQFHPQKDTVVTVPLDLLERAEQTQRTFTIVLGLIAFISLIVGGVGITNIMLATVTERTKEIGIRRALGAKRHDIAAQFLAEAVVLAAIGGILGMCAGLGASYAVNRFFPLKTIITPWSPALAFAVSVVVGLISGTYPARRAATLDPIEALRHE